MCVSELVYVCVGLAFCDEGVGVTKGGEETLPGTVESLSPSICRLVQLTALYEYSTRVEMRVFILIDV